MVDDAVDDDLPKGLIALLQKLERLTGHMPRAWVMAFIVLIGALFTGASAGVVWWAQLYRDERALLADVEQTTRMMQVRLDQRGRDLQQMAVWLSHQPAGSSEARVERNGALLLVRPLALQTSMLDAGLNVPSHTWAFLRACLQNERLLLGLSVCRVPGERGQADASWLVASIPQSARGWVLAPLDARDLNIDWNNGVDHMLQGRVVSSLSTAGAPAQESARDVELMVADQMIPGRVAWRSYALSWPELLRRQGALWVAIGAGALFTLAALHAYLMLIATRRRASNLAHDMSQALQHSQSRNQAVMDTAPDAIIMTDRDGCVRWCNQATVSLFGRTFQDLDGQHIGLILPALTSEPIEQWFATRGYSNRVIGCESMGVRAEGTAFPVALSASRVEVNGELLQTFIVRDTTDAKWAEQELLLRDRALASSADGVVITSMTLPNQPIIYVNKAFEDITGYEASEVLGQNCRLLQKDESDQPELQVIRDAIREGRGCQVVLRNYRKDGALFYNQLAISPVLSPEGQLTHYVGVQNDITDRIEAEQVLQLRTERLNAVFELSPDGFVLLDKRGEVSIVNPSFERMTGLCAGDLVGQSREAFEEVLMSRCKSSETQDIHGHAADGESGRQQRELLYLHTPTTRTLVRRVRRGEHDNEVVMYFRDITNEQEVDRMKSEFLAMAAHELRTPMVSIFGFTELLLKKPFSDERRHDMLATIHKQAGILINLVNELLDLARIEARRGKDFNRQLQAIEPIIEQALGGLKVPDDERKVQVQIDAGRAQVWADTDKLSQAVLNVLSNAYKYSPKGGDITLGVRPGEDGHTVVIEVRDHGIGMKPEELARVFERFFRADPSGNIPGTGLGMSLVKEIMQLHEGEVEVDSEFGAGTTVRLRIPAQMTPDIRGMEARSEVCTQ